MDPAGAHSKAVAERSTAGASSQGSAMRSALRESGMMEGQVTPVGSVLTQSLNDFFEMVACAGGGGSHLCPEPWPASRSVRCCWLVTSSLAMC